MQKLNNSQTINTKLSIITDNAATNCIDEDMMSAEQTYDDSISQSPLDFSPIYSKNFKVNNNKSEPLGSFKPELAADSDDTSSRQTLKDYQACNVKSFNITNNYMYLFSAVDDDVCDQTFESQSNSNYYEQTNTLTAKSITKNAL